MKTAKDTRTELQKKFEDETPTMKVPITQVEYLQTYCAWLELQVEKWININP